MTGDSASQPCYSLAELDGCYNSCPSLTTPNTTISNNPKCDVAPCGVRSPNSRGECALAQHEHCYEFEGACYSQCPGLTQLLPDENVWFFL
jgi:hypothetical protein